MNAAEAIGSHRAFLAEIGEDVIFRRYTGSGKDRPKAETTIRARVMEYAPSQIIGPVQVGDRKVIAMAESLTGSLPIEPGTGNDVLVVRDRELQIISVDDNTRRIGGTLVALEIQVRGR